MSAGSQDPGFFTDLNNDGSLEYIAPTRIWSRFCSGCQVWAPIVYEYQPKSGYIPATYKFSNVLASGIQRHLEFLAQFTKQNPNMAFHFLSRSDNPSPEDEEYWQYSSENSEYPMAVNTLYQLTIYYLLAGEKTNAQKILAEHFPADIANEHMLAIQKDIEGLLPNNVP